MPMKSSTSAVFAQLAQRLAEPSERLRQIEPGIGVLDVVQQASGAAAGWRSGCGTAR